jgi:hypothetical protein
MEDESIMHALVSCNHAAALRDAMRHFWLLPDEEQFTRINPASLLHLVDSLDTDIGARVLLLLWHTWQVRNNITQENGKLSIDGSVKFLQKYWLELCDIRQQDNRGDPKGKLPFSDTLCVGKKQRVVREKSRWAAPQEGWLKINVDVAHDASSGESGVGVIIRNHKGEVFLLLWIAIHWGSLSPASIASSIKKLIADLSPDLLESMEAGS